jgi:DHA1 family multidrug resistance protein-like MFS transporter
LNSLASEGVASSRPQTDSTFSHVRNLLGRLNPGRDLPSLLPSRNGTADAAVSLREQTMRRFWWEGVFGESSEVVWFQYLTLYLLFLGAGPGLIGAVTSIISLASALSTVAGAAIAERTGKHKSIVVISNGASRAVFLVMAVLPWAGGATATVGVLIAACVLRGVLSSFCLPAWNAMAADAIPQETRGRYFAFRNFGKQGTSMALTPVVGLLLSVMTGAGGWQLLWLASAGLGVIATVFLVRMPAMASGREHRAAPPMKSEASGSVREILRHPYLMRLVGTTSLFQLSVMVAGPFFSVYLVQHMHASAFWVGIVATASPLTAMLCQPFLGRLADRTNPAMLLVAANALIILTPLFWVVSTAPWHVVLINLIGGAAWQANQLATFNSILENAPSSRLPSFAAAHQMGMFAVTFVGPLAGGLVIGVAGFRFLFLLSAVGRLVATLLQYRLLVPSEERPSMARLLRLTVSRGEA